MLSLPFFLVTTKLDLVCFSWFDLFLISLDESWRDLLWEESFLTVEHGGDDVICRSELRSINALSSSSILISTVRSSLMTLLKKFRCSNTVVSSSMCNIYSCFLRYSLLEKFFIIYNVSSLDHNPVAIFSSITLYIILSVRYSWIVLAVFRSISSQSLSDVPASFNDLH